MWQKEKINSINAALNVFINLKLVLLNGISLLTSPVRQL
jgi:hypothetical protein